MRIVILIISLSFAGCGVTFSPSAGEVDDTRLDGWPSPSQLAKARGPAAESTGPCELTGSTAVDTRTGTRFFVQAAFNVPCADVAGGTPAVKQLMAERVGGAAARVVADLTGLEDLRLVFVRDHLLVMARRPGRQLLISLDAKRLVETSRFERAASYGGARVSPSGRYVLFADESRFDWSTLSWPLHLFDSETGQARVLDVGGHFADARWTNDSDQLLVVSQSLRFSRLAETRVMLWSLEQEPPAAGDLSWSEPTLAVTVPRAGTELWFTFEWLAVSPDDRRAVIPLEIADGSHALLVMDLATGACQRIRDAVGPAIYTRDGANILAFRETDAGWSLLQVDVETMAVAEVPLTDAPRRSFESPFRLEGEGSVVIESWQTSMLYDRDAGLVTPVTGALARLGI